MSVIERCWVWQRASDGAIGVAIERGTADAIRAGGGWAFFEEMVPATTTEGAVKALERIAAGDVPGTGDFIECVQDYARDAATTYGGQ
jgi:hypothetical protein